MERASTYVYVFVSCLVGIAFWISLAASVDIDYAITRFTFADAIGKTVRTPVTSVFRDNYAQPFLWFLVSVILAIITLFLQRPLLRIGLVLIALPFSFVPVGPCVAMMGLTFPVWFLIAPDGETWGEAFPTMSAIGVWIFVSVCYVIIQWFAFERRRNTVPTKASNATSEPAPSADSSSHQG
jgi:hypothetical protein